MSKVSVFEGQKYLNNLVVSVATEFQVQVGTQGGEAAWEHGHTVQKTNMPVVGALQSGLMLRGRVHGTQATLRVPPERASC